MPRNNLGATIKYTYFPGHGGVTPCAGDLAVTPSGTGYAVHTVAATSTPNAVRVTLIRVDPEHPHLASSRRIPWVWRQ